MPPSKSNRNNSDVTLTKYKTKREALRKKWEADRIGKDEKYEARLQAGVDNYHSASQEIIKTHNAGVDKANKQRQKAIDQINRDYEAEVEELVKRNIHKVKDAFRAWEWEKRAAMDCVKRSRIRSYAQYDENLKDLRRQLLVSEDKDDKDYSEYILTMARARDISTVYMPDKDLFKAVEDTKKAKMDAPVEGVPVRDPPAHSAPTRAAANNAKAKMAVDNEVVEVFATNPEPNLLKSKPSKSPPKRKQAAKASAPSPSSMYMPPHATVNRQLSPLPWPTRTILFDELFEGGNAQHKHIIVPWQAEGHEKKYYILRCDEHGVHFGKSPIMGAAKHLVSAAHRAKDKAHPRAISKLGVQVMDCNDALMEKNNTVAVATMSAPGWKPFNVRVNKILPRRGSEAQDDAKEPDDKPAKSPLKGITRPLDRHIYVGTCKDAKNPVIVIGWGNDLAGVGQPENYRSSHLPQQPECYLFDPTTKDIIGWAPGYEDDGSMEQNREFPVLWACSIDEDGDPCWGMMWVRAELLSEFDTWNTDDNNPLNISVRQYFAHDMHGFDNIEAMAHSRGQKLKNSMEGENDDNDTLTGFTCSQSLSPPIQAQPIPALKRKKPADVPESQKTPTTTATRPPQSPPETENQRLIRRNTDALVTLVNATKQKRGPDDGLGSALKRPRHSLIDDPLTMQQQPISRLSSGNDLLVSYSGPVSGFTSPVLNAYGQSWVKPELGERGTQDQLRLAPASREQSRASPLWIPSLPSTTTPRPFMMTPVSASSPPPSLQIADQNTPRRKVEDAFSLVGIIRRQDSWVRKAGTIQTAKLEIVSNPNGPRIAEVVGMPIHVVVDPQNVVHLRRIISSSEQANLTMVMADEEEVTLMFAPSMWGGDCRAAVLAARLFQHWLTSANAGILLMAKTDSHSYLLRGENI